MSDDRAVALRRAGAPLPPALIDPDAGRVPPDAPGRADSLSAHAAAVAAGEDGYMDPNSGLFVFTARHHWDKGTCCELGCRHCPWVNADARLRRGSVRDDA